jgi:hypothetical protein
MNTLQIDHALRTALNGWTRRHAQQDIFRGTFALNQVPLVYTLNPPYGLVVNTEPSTQDGDHWIALFQSEEGQPVDILDTRGYSRHHHYISHLVDSLDISEYRMNRSPLQSVCSSVCGEYCVLFLYCRICGWSFDSFLSLFSETDLYANDCFVHDFVHQHFNILNYPRDAPALYSKTLCFQTSKNWNKK